MFRLVDLLLAFALVVMPTAGFSHSTPIEEPIEEEPILTLVWGEKTAQFSDADLRELDLIEIQTSSDWTNGRRVFMGPRIRDVIAVFDDTFELKSDGTVKAVAVNDYAVEIPTLDFKRYDVILALEMDGVRLTLRDKGPLWIVYPRDDHPELVDPMVNARWVWQLERLELK